MTNQNFVHLHNHTEFSMLDGAATHKALFAEVDRLGMPAVAMTDHGNTFGAYEFWKTSQKFSAKPIIGIEGYVAPSSRLSRKQEFWADQGQRERANSATSIEGSKDVSGGGRYTHITMLARNAAGLRNVFRLSTLASYEGFYAKPRVDRELLAQFNDGIIATTGCPSGEIQTRLRLGQYSKALEAAATYQEIFGAENYFLEVMDHGIGIEREVRGDLLRLGRDLGLPLVATNDSHYVRQEDAIAHSHLLCVQSGSTMQDPNRFKFDGDGYYIKSAEEMRHIWRELPEACDNTLAIAEQIEDYAEVFERVDRMPRFPVPEGETQESWFRHEVQEGLHRRYPDGIPDESQRQADYEIDVILAKGYPSYFLVVADFINWAKSQGILVGPGRGSGCGSMCAYAMRITELDPLEHKLIFERFLNPERPSMPDFDIDFDDRRRAEVIAYVTEKYGPQYTAMVNTFGKIKAKQAVKDSAKVLGHPFSLGEKISKALPPDQQGRSIALADIFDPEAKRYEEGAEIRSLCEKEPDVAQVLEAAQGIENLTRQTGVHAAAVILSSDPLMDVIPMHRRNEDGVLITGFDYPSCEDMGLVKMDFLGLRNLTIVSDAIKMIASNRGTEISLRDLTRSPDDMDVYRMLGRGETLGIFQVEGGGMRVLLRLMRPSQFEHISAALALYRPGPMGAESHTNYALRKNGAQQITPIHRELEEPLSDILSDTYGLICYQEQVQQIAQKVAGYTLGAADNLRRAMGKKKKEVLDAEYVPFEAGMLKNGYSRECVQALWNILVPFSDYAFNRAHTAAYGMITYWTAFLKCHYPTEYMAALLTNFEEDKDKMALYLSECRRMGVKVLPPDVNDSDADFTAVGDDIRFGLTAIRNVGHNVVTTIRGIRNEGGPFASFEDFVRRVPASACNKRTIEALIKGGAFDSLGHPRQGLIAVYEQVIDAAAPDKKAAAIGQESLFDEPAPEQVIPNIEWERRVLLAFERKMLGLYVSGHPLDGLGGQLAQFIDRQVLDIITDEEVVDRTEVAVAGLLTSITEKTTKKGDFMAIGVLEDLSGSIEVVFFPKTYAKVKHLLMQDSICWIGGRINVREESVNIAADDVRPLDDHLAQVS